MELLEHAFSSRLRSEAGTWATRCVPTSTYSSTEMVPVLCTSASSAASAYGSTQSTSIAIANSALSTAPSNLEMPRPSRAEVATTLHGVMPSCSVAQSVAAAIDELLLREPAGHRN